MGAAGRVLLMVRLRGGCERREGKPVIADDDEVAVFDLVPAFVAAYQDYAASLEGATAPAGGHAADG